MMLRQILNPDIYHGIGKKKNFFEGWYFKIENSQGNVFAFIPGVFLSPNNEDSFSFIQVFYGNTPDIKFIKFPYSEFVASKSSFDVNIHENAFSCNSISLNIDQADVCIKGTLSFKNIINWPDSVLNPGSMGFYNYLTFMECYSQVCVIAGEIEGELLIDGEIIDFSNGKIYIEKNWGKAFPRSYIWTQCGSFNNRNLSFSCSIGNIPMPIGSFTGFLIGLKTEDAFYKFTTINRSRLYTTFTDNSINITAENSNFKVSFEVVYVHEDFTMLYAPKNGTMVPIAEESLNASVKITLWNNRKDEPLIIDSGFCAGVEFSGDYQNLCKKNNH